MKVYPISMIGGVLPLVSLALPWFSMSITEPTIGLTVSVGASGFDLFSLQGSLGLFGTLPGGFGTSLTLMLVGVVIALIGGILSFLHYVGGAVTLAGSVCGVVGALMFGQAIAGLGGGAFGVSAGPSFGVFLTLIAGVVALVGFAKPLQVGITAPPSYPSYPSYAGYPYGYAPMYPPMYPVPGTAGPAYFGPPPPPPGFPAAQAPQPVSTSAGTPDPTPPPTSLEAPAPLPAGEQPPSEGSSPEPAAVEPPGLVVCPTCGQPATSRFCPRDGTELVRAPAVA